MEIEYTAEELKNLKSIAEDTRSFSNSVLAKWILKIVRAVEEENRMEL